MASDLDGVRVQLGEARQLQVRVRVVQDDLAEARFRVVSDRGAAGEEAGNQDDDEPSTVHVNKGAQGRDGDERRHVVDSHYGCLVDMLFDYRDLLYQTQTIVVKTIVCVCWAFRLATWYCAYS